ncbi:MAG: hypothetical protein LQ342_002763 [Letrouitia transgressa]|nr:MAG: hypothetical protein LQ342_002763 [Letrouitia transgressa]
MEKAKDFARKFPGRRFWCADPISVDSIKTVLSNASNPLADVQQFWRSTGNGMSQRRKQLALCDPDQSPLNTSSFQRDSGTNRFPPLASGSIQAKTTSDSLLDASSESRPRQRTVSDTKVSSSNNQTDTGKATARPSLDKTEPKSDFKSHNLPDGLYRYQLAVHSPPHTTAHTELGSEGSFREQVNIRNKVAQIAIPVYPDDVEKPSLGDQAESKSNGRERAKETLRSLAVFDDDQIDSVLEESRRKQEETLERLRLEKSSNSLTREYYIQLGKEAIGRLCPGSSDRHSPTPEDYIQLGKEKNNQSFNTFPSSSDSWSRTAQNVEHAMEGVETISPFLSSTQLEQKAVSTVHENGPTPQTNRLQPHFRQRFPSLYDSYTTKQDEKYTGPPRLRHQPKFPSLPKRTRDTNSKTEATSFSTDKKLPADMTHDVPRSPYSTAPFQQLNPYQSIAQTPSQTSIINLKSTEGVWRKAVPEAPSQKPPLIDASPQDNNFSIPRKPLPRSLQVGIFTDSPTSEGPQALNQIHSTASRPSISSFLPHPPPTTPASLRHATVLSGILHNLAIAKTNNRLGKKKYRPYRPNPAPAPAQASHSQHWMSLRRTHARRRKATAAKPVGRRLESVHEIGLEPLDPFSPFTCSFPVADTARGLQTGPVARLAWERKPARRIHVASSLDPGVETFGFDGAYFTYRHHARRRLLQIDSSRWLGGMKGRRRLTLGWAGR